MTGDNDLILKARGGDMTAFNELVQRHDRAVLSLAARYVDNAEDAKDVFQEVLIKVYRALPTFQFRSEFSTWLHRITVNVCLTHRARSKSNRHVSIHGDSGEGTDGNVRELASSEAGPDGQAAAAHTAALVHRALDTLSPQQRMVFILRHYDGHSLREIARALHCTEGTVKRYLFMATRRLRKELEDLL